MNNMNASKGILIEVAWHICRHSLSLQAAREINSAYGWTIKGFPTKVHLTEEELLLAYNDYTDECPYGDRYVFWFKDSIRNNVIFTLFAFVISIYAFDFKLATKSGTQGSLYGWLFLIAGLYLLRKVFLMVREKKQLTKN